MHRLFHIVFLWTLNAFQLPPSPQFFFLNWNCRSSWEKLAATGLYLSKHLWVWFQVSGTWGCNFIKLACTIVALNTLMPTDMWWYTPLCSWPSIVFTRQLSNDTPTSPAPFPHGFCSSVVPTSVYVTIPSRRPRTTMLWDLEVKPWDREMRPETVRVGRSEYS